MSAPFPKIQAFLLAVLTAYTVYYLPIAQPVHVLWHTYEPRIAAKLKTTKTGMRVYAVFAFIAHTAIPLVPMAQFAFMFFAGRPWGAPSSPIISMNPNAPKVSGT